MYPIIKILELLRMASDLKWSKHVEQIVDKAGTWLS